MGKAAELARKQVPNYVKKVSPLRDALEKGILDSIADVELNGHPAHRLTNATNITFRGIESAALLLLLDQEDVCASSGSACLADSDEPSHVIHAMKPDTTASRQMIRLSLGLQNTRQEIGAVLPAIRSAVAALRA
jgi:cysteine desulfurase